MNVWFENFWETEFVLAYFFADLSQKQLKLSKFNFIGYPIFKINYIPIVT